MIKKKGKGKATGRRSTKAKDTGKAKSERQPEEVRKEIEQLVQDEAKSMAQAVIGEGKKGQLAPVKYMFEMAKIFPPPANDGSEVSKDEECLAKTLLDRLKIPHEPAKRDDDEEEEMVVIPARGDVVEGEKSKTFTTEDTEGIGGAGSE